MKRTLYSLGSTILFALPFVSSAQITEGSDAGPFEDLLGNILQFTNDVLIPFIIGIGFLVFVWGMFQYFIAGGANDDKKEKGKSLMIYATLGFVLIIIFWGVVNFVVQSIGLEGEQLDNPPTVPEI